MGFGRDFCVIFYYIEKYKKTLGKKVYLFTHNFQVICVLNDIKLNYSQLLFIMSRTPSTTKNGRPEKVARLGL